VDEAALKLGCLQLGLSAHDLADALAEAKAVKVSASRSELTLGADQTLELDGQVFDKPQTLEGVRRQLQTLRGRNHTLHAAAVLALEGRPVWRHVESVVVGVRDFSESFLEDYLSQEGDAVLDCVGAYKAEGVGLQLLNRIDGSHYAVLGLPMLALLQALRDRGELQR
jgi:septum formation protein